MRRNSSTSNCSIKPSSSVWASTKVSSSSASTASSTRPSTSSVPWSSLWIVSTICSRATFSLPSACALSGSFQTSGLSNSRLTSSKRSDFASKSKIPPKRFSALADIFYRIHNGVYFKHSPLISLKI